MADDKGLERIAPNAQSVVISFKRLQSSLETSPHISPKITQLSVQFDNEFTRFKMWAGSHGALQARTALSLDDRLKEASHLHDQVNYLLHDAVECLDNAAKQVALISLPSVQIPSTQSSKRLEPVNVKPGVRDDSFASLEKEEPIPLERLETLLTDVGEVVDCLIRLSVALANPTSHDRPADFAVKFNEAAGYAYRETQDIAYVRDKFPQMDYAVAAILGKANNRRRQIFHYKKLHHGKLDTGKGPSKSTPLKVADGKKAEIVPPMTTGRPLEEAMQTLNIGYESATDDDSGSDDMVSTFPVKPGGFIPVRSPLLRVPYPPMVSSSGDIECPFCFVGISATSRPAWR